MKKLIFLISILSCLAAEAQDNVGVNRWQTDWYASARMAGTTGEYMPFWARTGEDGILPVRSSGLMTAGADISYRTPQDIFFETGANFAGALSGKSPLNDSPSYAFIDRLYLSAGWKMFRMDVGLKPRHGDLGDLSITGGDVMLSGNARNLPGINLSSEWIYLERGKWFGVKGNLAHYHLFDNRCTQKPMVHDKSVAIRVAADRRIELMAGFHHYAHWGGVSEVYGTYPFSVEDYIKIFFAKRGDENDSLSDQLNVFGNHLGNEWARLIYRMENYSLTFQYDKPFEDNSGMMFKNFPDGVWTLQLSAKDRNAIVTDVTCEYIYTMWQSGDTHDRPATEEEMAGQDPESPWYGRVVLGGMDNYFNNSHYHSGWTHYGRTMGLPLLTPAMPDENGVCHGVVNTRVKGYNLGIKGVAANIPYKFRATYTENSGTYNKPFTEQPWQLSLALEASFSKDALPVEYTFGLYGDIGELYQDSIGLTLKIAYRGGTRF